MACLQFCEYLSFLFPCVNVLIFLQRVAHAEFDPLVNALDNYAALLCCAFVHSGVVDGLCLLGTRGVAQTAKKARLAIGLLLMKSE